MDFVNTILTPFLLLMIFWYAIIDHAVNFKGASRSFGTLLGIYSIICLIIIIAILITTGFNAKWWTPIILGLGGFIVGGIVNSILIGITGGSSRYIISLLGIVLVPVIVYIIASRIWF